MKTNWLLLAAVFLVAAIVAYRKPQWFNTYPVFVDVWNAGVRRIGGNQNVSETDETDEVTETETPAETAE